VGDLLFGALGAPGSTNGFSLFDSSERREVDVVGELFLFY
jgi:hypothetical protein